jgi:hypothetical protein
LPRRRRPVRRQGHRGGLPAATTRASGPARPPVARRGIRRRRGKSPHCGRRSSRDPKARTRERARRAATQASRARAAARRAKFSKRGRAPRRRSRCRGGAGGWPTSLRS